MFHKSVLEVTASSNLFW